MTWGNWVDSKYNTGDYMVFPNDAIGKYPSSIIKAPELTVPVYVRNKDNTGFVRATELIEKNINYPMQ